MGEQVAEYHTDTSVGVRVLGLGLVHMMRRRVLLRLTPLSTEASGAGKHPELADKTFACLKALVLHIKLA